MARIINSKHPISSISHKWNKYNTNTGKHTVKSWKSLIKKKKNLKTAREEETTLQNQGKSGMHVATGPARGPVLFEGGQRSFKAYV